MASSCLTLFLQGEIFITQAKRKQTSLCVDCQGADTVTKTEQGITFDTQTWFSFNFGQLQALWV